MGMLGSVKSEKVRTLRGRRKLGNGQIKQLIKLIRLGVIIIHLPI